MTPFYILVTLTCTSAFTVSGLSSGGFFSTQFHVAFSSNVTGAGVLAGGPYYCSEGSQNKAEIDCLYNPLLINLNACISEAKNAAASGKIDPTSNLNSASVYIFSGTKDTVVNPGVVKKAVEFYQSFVTNGKIVSNFTTPAEHAWITNTYGNACAHLGTPYINNCNLDVPGIMLLQFLGSLNPRVAPIDSNLLPFNQATYGDIKSASLSKTGYVYVPNGCKGSKCQVHVAFHGCQQSAETIGKTFVQYNGLNDWAESNNIVVIYPQITSEILKNPQGCWDFWGYTNKNFAYKSGLQMSIVFSMAGNVPGVSW